MQDSKMPQMHRISESIAARLARQRRAHLANAAGSDLLYNLVISHKNAQCVDVRDKVFGLHSLTRDCCKIGTPVDYDIPPYTLCDQLLYHHFTHHQTTSTKIDVIHHSQIVHNIFQDGFRDGGDQRLPRNSTDATAQLEALGNIRGTIIWECPVTFRTASEWTLRQSRSDGRQPAMTTALAAQLNHVVQKLNLQWSSSTLVGDAIEFDCMDAVTLTPNDRSYAVELPYEDMSTPGTTTHTAKSQETQKLDTKLFTTGRVSPRLKPLPPTTEPFPRSALIRDVIVDWQEDRLHPRMFFEENGMIGFAPGGTQIGDLISQFKDSDVAVVLRKIPDQDRYQIVGRAANAYPTGPPRPISLS